MKDQGIVIQHQNSDGTNAAVSANYASTSSLAGTMTQSPNIFNGSFVSSSKYKQLLALNAWIIDTGASDHMCHDAKLFESLSPLKKTLPNHSTYML